MIKFIPNTLPKYQEKRGLLLNFIGLTGIFAILYVFVSYVINFPQGIWIMFTSTITHFLNYVLYDKKYISYRISANMYITNCFFGSILGCAYYSGGLYSPVSPWFVLIPVISLLLLGNKIDTICWFIFSLTFAYLFSIGLFIGWDFPEAYNIKDFKNFFFVMCWTGLIAIIYLVGFLFERDRQFAQDLLRKSNEELILSKEELATMNEELIQQQEELTIINEVISENSKHITSSISYASNIQHALLPPEQDLKDFFGDDYFVFFKPRDIVSGDFYWCEKHEDTTFVAVADCTGHGVPGAFMSMLGIAEINSVVFQKDIYSPELILNNLHDHIYQILRQSNKENRDGMDIVLMAIHHDKKIVEFAGAMNTLYYIQNEQLFEIKGDKNPVGGFQYGIERNFTKHIIDIQTPTTFYLMSDGLQDQFGGKDGKKFGKIRLRELLMRNHLKSLAFQKEVIKEALLNWMQESREKQIDDILVMGIKV